MSTTAPLLDRLASDPEVAREREEHAFRAFLAVVRGSAPDRERDRVLLHEENARLRALGFGALRLPVALGGAGLTLRELFERIVDLAAADPNLAHIWRGHVAFVETLLLDPAGPPSRWVERLLAGDFVGNAQSERQETGRITTRIERAETDGRPTLSGRKYYTTGSIYAQWIHLAALDGEDRVGVTVDARLPGVSSVDDWDGFGQPLTGSGTTTFDRVPVEEAEIDRVEAGAARWRCLGSIFQLHLLAVVAGIAQRALEDTVDYVRPRKRTFGYAGERTPSEDPLVQVVVGRLSAAAYAAARSLVLGAAQQLDEALAGEEPDADALQRVQLDVFRLQQVVPQLVLGAATELFEVGGASAASARLALDRHWRNVRTIAVHNPSSQRVAALGQFELLGTLPEWKAPSA
ncbi:MAG: hypothetical protein J7480_01930 [Microbacteriaceae bacterium]|nr:hypothetical protein [Microbacteriaceae bacterium]